MVSRFYGAESLRPLNARVNHRSYSSTAYASLINRVLDPSQFGTMSEGAPMSQLVFVCGAKRQAGAPLIGFTNLSARDALHSCGR